MGFLPSGNPAEWTIENVKELIINVTSLALLLADAVAIVYILIGAFNYLTAFGNEEKATAGKNTLTWAIIGLILIILAQVIVGEIKRFIGAS